MLEVIFRVEGVHMQIKSLRIKNFRGYKDETTVNFEDLTAFVGKNDVGKSTILEALDIFFNDGKGCVKLDKDDICKMSDSQEIEIAVVFDHLPDQLVLDHSYKTTLKDEYLLNKDGLLEVVKKYPNAGKSKVFVRANHPTGEHVKDLLSAKNGDLKKIVDTYNIQANRTINSEMRKAIWRNFEDELDLQLTEVDVSKEDAKEIWTKLQYFLPTYSLFQSDRTNDDEDGEIQDPLKESVKAIINDPDLKNSFNTIYTKVTDSLNEVASRTLKKMKEMDKEVAKTLNPKIPSVEDLKWADVFKNVSITGDNDIPMNKRGSGVRRLILLSFFRAEAEYRLASTDTNNGIIYAIEEPETSQHTANQRMLAGAFKELSQAENTQVILTTHSATVVKALAYNQIRIITDDASGKQIKCSKEHYIRYPSLNEVNYSAFGEVSIEYHIELFNELHERLKEMKRRSGDHKKYNSISSVDKWLEEQPGAEKINYNSPDCMHYNHYRDNEDHTMTAYIRNYFDHPGDNPNHEDSRKRVKPTYAEIKRSIEFMAHLLDTKLKNYAIR
ncbi:MAG: ATP-binding protein [Lactobacillus sp.]|nr:ATP-binding protein [Lactobacillus sp.]